ncbi:MAG: DNA starvation/stationary phase protection protein Dps [Deltaproteobacteria bacterium]|nr:MAG: DNA starvation/stationary phase protection protein Dps [Deltaproteobacteria bacterium]
MRSTRIVIAEPTRQTLVRSLNHVLSDMIALRLQAQHAHWNVRGRLFAPRHELFEQLFTNLDAAIDRIAERITALGGGAEGRIAEVSRMQSIPAYQPEDAQSHLPALADSYGSFASMVREELSRSARLDEPVTEDMLTELLRNVEHDLFLLEAHLDSADQALSLRGHGIRPMPPQEAIAEAK